MVAVAVDANGTGLVVGCQQLAGLVVAVAMAVDADGAGLAVEMAAELAVAQGARRSLAVVGMMVKKKRHRLFWQSLDSVDAIA